MNANDNRLTVKKEEARTPAGVERIARKPVFVPAADICERADSVVIYADLPGVDEKSLEITLEKNTLQIRGSVSDSAVSDHHPWYAEYQTGDFERSFLISNEVDREAIKARLQNGVLELTLPKGAAARTRKIAVQAN